MLGEEQKIPHIGWSKLQLSNVKTSWQGTLLEDNNPGESAYFVHSFMAVPSNPAHKIAECMYGDHLIPAAIGRDQISGCQFHPEKSGEVGLKILRRFISQ
jgi:glutamine amidotransferase